MIVLVLSSLEEDDWMQENLRTRVELWLSWEVRTQLEEVGEEEEVEEELLLQVEEEEELLLQVEEEELLPQKVQEEEEVQHFHQAGEEEEVEEEVEHR